MMPQEERQKAFEDRQEELDDLAGDLRRLSRRAWLRPAAFALTIAGAGLTAVTGDRLGGLLAAGAGAMGLASGGGGLEDSTYSYLFRVTEAFP
jgi:hypothetical protein